MNTQEGENVCVCAIHGNFDDAQTGVKKIFTDPALKAEFAQHNKMFSSANSINWGRLLPQIVYYFSAYLDLVNAKKIKMGDAINVVVPTATSATSSLPTMQSAWVCRYTSLSARRTATTC